MNKCILIGLTALFCGVVLTGLIRPFIHFHYSTVLFLWVDDLHSRSTNHMKAGYARTCAQEAE